MNLKVNVTAKDIRGAYAGSTTDCPLARAIKRAIKKTELQFVSTGYSGLALFKDNKELDYICYPRKALKLQTDIFEGKKGKPISFVLSVK